MLLKETLAIIHKLMTDLDVSDFKVSNAEIWIHESNEEDEEAAIQSEYDIILEPVVTHWQLQQIDEFLSAYDNVEMKVESEGLRIFEKEA